MSKKAPSTHCYRTISRAKINNIRLYLKKYCLRSNPEIIFFYEVKGSDGSYFKTTDKTAAASRFEKLKEFESRQSNINF